MCSNKFIFSFKTLKLITFDVTGTLLQFKRPPVEVYMEIGSKHGIVVKDRESMVKAFKKNFQFLTKTEPHFGKSWYEWWRTFVFRTFEDSGAERGQLSPQKLNAIANELITLFKTKEVWRVSDSGIKLLQEIKAQNPIIYTGIISNFDTRLHEILKANEILKYFDFVVTSHECQISKPDPKIFQIAYNLGQNLLPPPKLKPSEILHVGDNYELDCISPKSLGWNVCLIGNKKIDAQSALQVPTFSNLDELLIQLKS